MANYKKQHFLPVSYLSNFSDDTTKRDRNSFVWRIDKERQVRVPVNSQCYENFFYSQSDPEAAEKSFHRREGAFCKIMNDLWQTEDLVEISMGDLFQYMFDLNLRNAAHENRTQREGFVAYQHRMNMFLTQLLLNADASKLTPEQLGEKIKLHIKINWRMEVVKAAPDTEFITSDHPSIFMTCTTPIPRPQNALQMILLPLNPTHTAIAFDRRRVWVDIRPTATESDMMAMNISQLGNARTCIYCAREFNADELANCRNQFEIRPKNKSIIDDSKWSLCMTYLEPKFQFSFLELKPPLL